MELQDLCMGCMAETGGVAVCPLCGFAESQATTGGGLYLPPRTVLNGRYVIGRVLGQGGFGIIYLTLDVTLNLKVAIKEFLPRELAARGADGVSVSVYQDQARQWFAYGLEQFLAEARTLARLSEHQGIVTVRDFFTANGTGYLAMSYLDGITLKDYVARKGGRLPFLTGFRTLLPVMDALREVHALGLLHRDISPDNIYLTRDNQARAIRGRGPMFMRWPGRCTTRLPDTFRPSRWIGWRRIRCRRPRPWAWTFPRQQRRCCSRRWRCVPLGAIRPSRRFSRS